MNRSILHSAFCILHFVFLLFATATVGSAQTELQGQIIRSIRFEPDVKFATADVEERFPIKAGEPYSRRRIQASVESLFATGNFRDVQVDATTTPEGIDLIFYLSIHYRIEEIHFEGVSGENRQRASRELQLRRGDVLSLDAVERSGLAIQESLRRRGYLEVLVDPSTSFEREENRVEVTFFVTLGPQAHIGAIQLEGNIAPFTQAELLKAMRRDVGDEYRADRARTDADRLENFLLNRGHRRADVRFLDAPYDAAADTVSLRYRVNVGPEVRVEVTGVDRSTVRRWLPFDRNEGYSGDAIERARDTIIEQLQRRGYFFAAVDIEEQMVGEEFVITYRVDRGERYEIDDIVFEGNETISDDRIREVIGSSERGGFRAFLANLFRRPTGVTQDQLVDDRDAIEALYRIDGFSEVKVGAAIPRREADGTLDIVFPIVEGTQTIVSEVRVEGNEQVSTERLPDLLLKAGEPLNPLLVQQDLITLQSFYADRGHVESIVSRSIKDPAGIEYADSTNRATASVVYRVKEGPRVLIDEVIVQGNSYTQTDVVLRKARLEKGEPFSYRRFLEAQRNLYRLGIFQRVDIHPEQTAGVPTADRDVIIQVDEGRNLTLSGSIGYDTERRTSTSLQMSHRNLFGTARYIGVEALVAELRQRYTLSYQEPFIFGRDIPTQLTIFRDDDERQERRVHFRRNGFFIETTRTVREQTEWSVRYEYREVECVIDPLDQSDLCRLATSENPLPGFPREDQEIQISSITPVFFWDRRNDPINPSQGFFASASAEYAFPLFDAKTNFAKLFAQSAWYRPLTDRSQLVVAGRLGVIEPLKPPTDPGGIVPFAERFLAGGETTHRAFKADTLGVLCEDPSDTDCQPTLIIDDGDIIGIGGNAMAIISAEYRFPVFAGLRGAVFVDGGNVFRDAADVLEVGEFRWGVGTGLRYLTPVGPIRLDIGFKLDRKPEEDPYATFLSLGYAF